MDKKPIYAVLHGTELAYAGQSFDEACDVMQDCIGHHVGMYTTAIYCFSTLAKLALTQVDNDKPVTPQIILYKNLGANSLRLNETELSKLNVMIGRQCRHFGLELKRA